MGLRHPGLAIIAVTLAAPALASTDGMYGPTSSGSFDVQATISPPFFDNVHVYNLQDFTFSGTEGSSFMSQTKSFCVIRQCGGLIGLTIYSAMMDMDFRVREPMGMNSIPLTLTVTVSGGSQSVMSQGVEQTFTAPADCSPMSMTLSNLQIDVPTAATAPQGYYTGTFLVNVAPK
jgi:hypothetical protein